MIHRKGSLAVGFPTIVNIMVLLIFACVSMLSLSHAKIDLMTAKHTVKISKEYYKADSKGQEILGLLSEYSSYEPDLAGHEMENILNEQGIAAIYKKDEQTLNFTLPAEDAGNLSVSIKLIAPSKYEITCWKLIPPESE